MTISRFIKTFLVLVAATSIDIIYAIYIKAVAGHSMIVATIASMTLGILSLLSVKVYTDGQLTAITWIIGLGLGTILAMSLNLI